MKYALVDFNNIVQNVIQYSGPATYQPPAGLTVQKVNDWVQQGQNINAPQPSPSLPPSPAPPDLATQLAAALINANVIPASAIDSATLATVNSTLKASGQAVIASVSLLS